MKRKKNMYKNNENIVCRSVTITIARTDQEVYNSASIFLSFSYVTLTLASSIIILYQLPILLLLSCYYDSRE